MEPATTLSLIQIPETQARQVVDDLGDVDGWWFDAVDYEDAVVVGLHLRLDDECPEVPAAVWTKLWRKRGTPRSAGACDGSDALAMDILAVEGLATCADLRLTARVRG